MKEAKSSNVHAVILLYCTQLMYDREVDYSLCRAHILHATSYACVSMRIGTNHHLPNAHCIANSRNTETVISQMHVVH